MQQKIGALTEREKDILRLLARGHDAKSAAGALQVSVNAINERLREARRKLETTSSREAARIFSAFESESTPETCPKEMGVDCDVVDVANDSAPAAGGVKQVMLLVSSGVGIMFAIVLLTTILAAPNEHGSVGAPKSYSSGTLPPGAAPSKDLRPTYSVTVEGALRGLALESSQMAMAAGSMASLSSAGVYELHFTVAPDLERPGNLLISANVVMPVDDATLRYSKFLSVSPGQPAVFELEAIGSTPSPGSFAITASVAQPLS